MEQNTRKIALSMSVRRDGTSLGKSWVVRKFLPVSLIVAATSCFKEPSFTREQAIVSARRELQFLGITSVECQEPSDGCRGSSGNGYSSCHGRDVHGISFQAACDQYSCWSISVGR